MLLVLGRGNDLKSRGLLEAAGSGAYLHLHLHFCTFALCVLMLCAAGCIFNSAPQYTTASLPFVDFLFWFLLHFLLPSSLTTHANTAPINSRATSSTAQARRQDAYGKMRAGFHGTVEEIRLAWRGLSNVQQIMVSFTVAHAAVWLLWKIPAPAVQRFVERFFCHEPMSGRLVQLVGCSVSHQSFVHMGLNTMVLWSFATPMVAALGVNQYLGFSLAAACSSATFSQIHSVLRRNPRGGLGASGILMGLIALTTVLHPEGQMHIIFLPAATISAPMYVHECDFVFYKFQLTFKKQSVFFLGGWIFRGRLMNVVLRPDCNAFFMSALWYAIYADVRNSDDDIHSITGRWQAS